MAQRHSRPATVDENCSSDKASEKYVHKIPDATAAQGRHIDALTGVRAIGVLLVFFAHLQQRYFPYPEFEGSLLAYAAYFGMTTFFVLSGFVIHWNYSPLFARKLPAVAWRKFFLARFSRLWPLHFAVTLLAMAQIPDLSKFVQHVFMVQSWIYQGAPNISYYSTWSISTEWFFYFFYAFCYPLFARRLQSGNAWVFGLLIAVSFSISFLVGQNHNEADMWIRYFAPYMRLLDFFTGVAAAQFVMIRRARHEEVFSDTVFAVVLMITVACYSSQLWTRTNLNYYIAPLIAVALIVATDRRTIIAAVLSHRWLVWIGDRSYSIYLLEAIYLVQIVRFETPMGFTYEPSRNFSFSSFGISLAWVIVAVSAVLLAADLCWRYFEIPSRNWIKGLFEGNKRAYLA